jgi:hypothetical protein
MLLPSTAWRPRESLAGAIVVYNVGVVTADSARDQGSGPAIAGSGRGQ